jgi:hypothetical protein
MASREPRQPTDIGRVQKPNALTLADTTTIILVSTLGYFPMRQSRNDRSLCAEVHSIGPQVEVQQLPVAALWPACLAVPPTSLVVWCRAGTVDAAYPYLLHLGLQVRGDPESA